jgi:probable rRNA maturation factor
MPDPESSQDIIVIIDKPCWKKPISQWEALIQPAVLETLRQSKWIHAAEINILLTDDRTMTNLNQTYRGLQKSTNVLSFPSLESKEIAVLLKSKDVHDSTILGDVVLAFETIEEESIQQHKSLSDHLVHLVVHGVLHLLGFDHENDKDAAIMESLEVQILARLNIRNPYEE